MLILAINTAEAACDVAVVRGAEILAEQREDLQRGQDGRLPGLVDDVLARADTSLTDLDRLAVVTGPGSFTGIRIGVAFARGLALHWTFPPSALPALKPDCRQR